jgi:hypothetical protein
MTRVMLIVAENEDQALKMVDKRELAEADCVVLVNPELSGAHTIKDRNERPAPVKVVTI